MAYIDKMVDETLKRANGLIGHGGEPVWCSARGVTKNATFSLRYCGFLITRLPYEKIVQLKMHSALNTDAEK